ncbi:unnamed protein product, partial [Staurois parvus]
MSNFYIFEFPASSVPHTSRDRRERNPEDGCWHGPEDIAGDAAGGHRGNAGQGKCWRDHSTTLQGNPECSNLGLPLLVLK